MFCRPILKIDELLDNVVMLLGEVHCHVFGLVFDPVLSVVQYEWLDVSHFFVESKLNFFHSLLKQDFQIIICDLKVTPTL